VKGETVIREVDVRAIEDTAVIEWLRPVLKGTASDDFNN